MYSQIFTIGIMIRIILNLWHRFKAVILVTYVLRAVLQGFYNRRNPYIDIILHKFKKPNQRTFSVPDIRSSRASIKAAHQESFEVVLKQNSLSIHFFTMIGIVWFGERMNINIKFNSPKLEDLFGNLIFTHSQKYGHRDIKQLKYTVLWENYAKMAIPSDYGYKVISKLAIKEEFFSQVNEWVDSNLQEDWVGVHYRGTDARRRFIKVETYIFYLKEVLDDHCDIFACSDQVQFIEQIKKAFPGRVFSREIIRSYDNRPLHKDKEYRGSQQMKDALIDVLVLSKAKLIYTTGSWFVDVVRFFNPSVKIVSFELLFPRFNYHKKIDNFIPVPKAYIIKKAAKKMR